MATSAVVAAAAGVHDADSVGKAGGDTSRALPSRTTVTGWRSVLQQRLLAFAPRTFWPLLLCPATSR